MSEVKADGSVPYLLEASIAPGQCNFCGRETPQQITAFQYRDGGKNHQEKVTVCLAETHNGVFSWEGVTEETVQLRLPDLL